MALSSFRLAPWIGIAFTLAAFLQLGLGLLPLNAKNDPTSRLEGWSQLGGDIERLRQDHGAGMVLTNRYAITGELAFYGGGPDGVAQINERIRYASLPNPNDSKLKNAPALLVLRKDGNATPAASFFGDSHRIATLTREDGFHPHDSYDVYFVIGYRGGLFGCGSASNQGSECN